MARPGGAAAPGCAIGQAASAGDANYIMAVFNSTPAANTNGVVTVTFAGGHSSCITTASGVDFDKPFFHGVRPSAQQPVPVYVFTYDAAPGDPTTFTARR